MISKTTLPMVVDDAASLQMGIDCNRTHVLQPPLFQVSANPVRQAVSGRDAAFLVTHVEIGLPLGKSPNVVAERTKLCPDFLKALGVVDDRFDFSPGADHTLGIQDALYIRLTVDSYFIEIKVIKTTPEKFPASGSSCSSSDRTA